MCWACDNERMRLSANGSFATYPIHQVVTDHLYAGKKHLAHLASEQRANFETAKFYHFLCDKHIAHYERVVETLEHAVTTEG